jgi:pseudouridine-5'-phosphate glycosidase
MTGKKESQSQSDEMGIGSVKFPSFFTAESQFGAPYAVRDEIGAAGLVHATLQIGLNSGLLIAVPIPKVHNGQNS